MFLAQPKGALGRTRAGGRVGWRPGGLESSPSLTLNNKYRTASPYRWKQATCNPAPKCKWHESRYPQTGRTQRQALGPKQAIKCNASKILYSRRTKETRSATARVKSKQNPKEHVTYRPPPFSQHGFQGTVVASLSLQLGSTPPDARSVTLGKQTIGPETKKGKTHATQQSRQEQGNSDIAPELCGTHAVRDTKT